MGEALNKMFGARQHTILLLLLALSAPSTLGMPQQFVKVGDMMLTAQQVPKTLWPEFGLKEVSVVAESPGLKNELKRWPEGVLNYELSSAVSSEHKALIRRTLAQLETKLDSCIKFREVNVGFRVIVVDNKDCSSAAGYRNGGSSYQELSLSANGCMSPSTIEHEFLHALGVFHTQQRTERDGYIKINWDNIQEGFAFAFSKLSDTEVDEFDLPYDFDSVMHYEQFAYSKNHGKLRTIETLDPSKQDIIGKAKGVSDGDIMLVKRMYKCNGGNTESTPTPSTSATPLPSPSNDWHYASISSSVGAENSFTWKNKAGIEWELTFIGEESSGVLMFKVGKNCPNKEQGYAEARLFKKNRTIEIEGPDGMFTKQEN